MRSPVRILLGLLFCLLGAVLIVLEIAWTTQESAPLLPIPSAVVDGVIFALGLAGLIAIYAGFRIARGR